jgi:hypothetical protein
LTVPITRHSVNRFASALLEGRLALVARGLHLALAGVGGQHAAALPSEHAVEDQREDEDDDPADAAPDDHAARGTASSATPDLRGVEGDVVVEAHPGLRRQVRGPRGARRHLD